MTTNSMGNLAMNTITLIMGDHTTTQIALNSPTMHKITALITLLKYVHVWRINPAPLRRICWKSESHKFLNIEM